MKQIGKILFLLYIFNFSAYAITQDTYPFTTIQDKTRFQILIQEIRCVVCQNQNIADSNAPLANDLREKIYKMVVEKKSNEEIKNYLTKRYGEFILLQPRFTKMTFILWLFPLFGLALALRWLLKFQRMSSK